MSVTTTTAYLAATAQELAASGSGRRFVGMANQAALFRHRGVMSLTGAALTLTDYLILTPGDVLAVQQRYTPQYTRAMAGGVRGGFPSLGLIRRLGAPLVLDVADGGQILLLLGFSAVWGTTKNREWLSKLRAFAARG